MRIFFSFNFDGELSLFIMLHNSNSHIDCSRTILKHLEMIHVMKTQQSPLPLNVWYMLIPPQGAVKSSHWTKTIKPALKCSLVGRSTPQWGEGMGRVCGRFQVQVPMRTKIYLSKKKKNPAINQDVPSPFWTPQALLLTQAGV